MNFVVDDERLEKLIEEAQRLGRHKTKEEAVTAALQEYIRHKQQGGIANDLSR